MVRRGACLAVLLLALVASAAEAVERRVALVIGNGAYAHASVLPNPANDAQGVAVVLRDLGFEVEEGIDLDRRAMEDVVRRFARRLDGAAVGLFFYAGHGLQVRGANHLVPVDAQLEHEADLPFQTFPLDYVLEQFESSGATGLALLDACRDNPLARRLARGMGATRSAAVGSGLAPVRSGLGTLIAYATDPDNVASDGEGRNSPFSAALIEHLAAPGLEVRSMLSRVRRDVIEATGGRQVPWTHESLLGEVYLVPAAAEPVAEAEPPSRPPELELALWQEIKDSDDPRDLDLYLGRFPDGVFAPLARRRLDGLRQSPAPDPAEVKAALGDDPRGVDGAFGPGTRDATGASQRAPGVAEVAGYPAGDRYARPLADAGLELAAADLSRTGCGKAQVVRGDNGALRVVGYRVEEDGAGAVPEESSGAEYFRRRGIDVSLVGLSPPLCRALNALAEHEPRRDEGIDVVLRNERSPEARDTFEDEDFLLIELPATDEPRYVALDYFSEDIVVHLYPPGGGLVPPGQPFRFGDPAAGGQTWRVAPPFGRDLLAVFVSARPLYEGKRPVLESSKDYLAFLRRRLAGAAPSDEISFNFMVVTAVPKGATALEREAASEPSAEVALDAEGARSRWEQR